MILTAWKWNATEAKDCLQYVSWCQAAGGDPDWLVAACRVHTHLPESIPEGAKLLFYKKPFSWPPLELLKADTMKYSCFLRPSSSFYCCVIFLCCIFPNGIFLFFFSLFSLSLACIHWRFWEFWPMSIARCCRFLGVYQFLPSVLQHYYQYFVCHFCCCSCLPPPPLLLHLH